MDYVTVVSEESSKCEMQAGPLDLSALEALPEASLKRSNEPVEQCKPVVWETPDGLSISVY
jgi:hypothetical protein